MSVSLRRNAGLLINAVLLDFRNGGVKRKVTITATRATAPKLRPKRVRERVDVGWTGLGRILAACRPSALSATKKAARANTANRIRYIANS